MGIHVDDMVVVSTSDDIKRTYTNKIKEEIDMKHLGEAKVVLGVQVEQEEGIIYVHQKDNTEKLLNMYGMKECNTVITPIDMNVKMENYEVSKRCDIKAYQELMRRQMFLNRYRDLI